MSKLRLLDFQYKSSKLRSKSLKWLSTRDRQISGLAAAFQPNREEMRRVFDKMDTDKDGKISLGDIKYLVGALGTKDVTGLAGKMMWAAGVERDGFISFKEFMEIQKSVSTGDIRAAFQYFDVDGDGRIGADDLKVVMERLGEKCTAEECRRMVRLVDKSGDELVDMDDFLGMMTATMKPIQ